VISRAAGAFLSVLMGVFWLGWLLLFPLPTEPKGGWITLLDWNTQEVLLFLVAPSLACILGGVLTLRGYRGWRWPPIAVCAFYAVLLADAPRWLIGYRFVIIGWNAAIVVLLLSGRLARKPASSEG
jgi:hypothetical protein